MLFFIKGIPILYLLKSKTFAVKLMNSTWSLEVLFRETQVPFIINEKFKGEFTNADRVLLTALHDRLLADPKLAKLARSSDPQIFTESIFPKAFDTAAQDSYLEAQDTFSSLFEDTSKYKAIMSALAEWLYGEFRKK